MDILKIIGRKNYLFDEDIANNQNQINSIISESSFLIIGGAGSIGQSVVKEIFKRNPKRIHVVDISENNIVELVRDIRSSYGYIKGDFQTFALDFGSKEFVSLVLANVSYDYILNLAALKHVRSEKDPFTLSRMIDVNIFNTVNSIRLAKKISAKRYFCISTDKAANPVNMMGASKKIMEMYLMRESLNQDLSTARFANVAFSDGSLLYGFQKRFFLKQPIAAPIDIKRYFITPEESGQLCLMSCLLGENRDIFFPKLNKQLKLTTFSEIATRYINHMGFVPYECHTEEEARVNANQLIKKNYWPCYFFNSDTTGEKDFEEFYTEDEELNLTKFKGIGIIKNEALFDEAKLDSFQISINKLKKEKHLSKEEIVNIFKKIIPNFKHHEKNKNLDQRM